MTKLGTASALAAGFIAVALLTGQVDGRAPSCLPMEEGTVAYALALATATDSLTAADRATYGVAAVPASEVGYVSDEAICADAAREYKAVAGLKGKAPAVHVVRVGARYIVSSPVTQTDASEFVLYVIMDDQFNVVSKFVS